MPTVPRDPDDRLFRPAQATGTGVLVLAGSSGRVDTTRAELLSVHGALALAIRWFGGHGQQPGPFHVPVELFIEALDTLAPECDRLAIVGTSFGAEAALITASVDHRVTATIAFAPTSVVWCRWDGTKWASHLTVDGAPLPFVPFLPDWAPADDPPAFVDLYRLSLDAAPAAAERAAIPVEAIRGEVVTVAGGDDRVWPSCDFADRITQRRQAHGLATDVVSNEHAGHRTVLPGEQPVNRGMTMQRGGTIEADRALGAKAWPHIVSALKLRRDH